MSGIISLFFGEGNDIEVASIPESLRDVLEPWMQRSNEGKRVAFLPRAKQGRLWWYGLAPDARSRRELLSLLDAWVGPTSSDLSSYRGRLDRADQFDAALAVERPGLFLRFEVLPREGAGISTVKLEVRNSLRRMVRLLDDRPISEFRAPRSSAEVLEDLGHAISASDRGLAAALLLELRASGDLDETNLAFLRMRVHAGLGLWQDVLTDPTLTDLLVMRRPVGVTRALQRATYGAHLVTLDEAERDEDLLASFEDVRLRYAGLERGSPPAISRPELVVQFLFALASEPALRPLLLERLLSTADLIEVGLRGRLERLQAAAETDHTLVPPPRQDPLAEATSRYWAGDAQGALNSVVAMPADLAGARLAVMAAAEVGTLEAARAAVNLVEADPRFRTAILASGVVSRAALEGVDRLIVAQGPEGWAAWFERLGAGAPGEEALGWARELGEHWTPLARRDVIARMGESSDAVLGVLGEVAGIFLEAHVDVLEGPSTAMVAERLIAALALSGRTSKGVQVQALNLIDILLAAEPSAEQVEMALEWLGMLRLSMAASGTIDWQVDLLQTIAYHPIPEGAHAARERYLYGSLEDLRTLRAALDSTALESVVLVCESLRLSLPVDLENLRAAARPEKDLYRCLAGRRVVLYSLIESASRRAAETLRRFVPSIDVFTTADHVGSDQLADISRNADFFVIVTASAKHAASEFIERERRGRPIIYVHSRGSSALLRELAKICT